MKVVIRRHAGHIQVIRACAAAQALAKEAEVAVETFHENKPLLDLFGVRWKDPRAPYACDERNQARGESRRGGKIWDFIVDLDGDGPFEPRWLGSKVGLGVWIKSELAKDFPDAAAVFESNPFPALKSSPIPWGSPDVVLLAPLSPDVNPNEIKANDFSAQAEKDHPGVPQVWLDFGSNFGPGRQSCGATTPLQIVYAITSARAVYTVNGLASALACCTWQGTRIARELHFIGSVPPKIMGTSSARDFERHRRQLLEVDAVPAATGVTCHRFDFRPIDTPP